MENSLKRYEDGYGCMYFAEQIDALGNIRYWCKRLHCFLTSPTELCKECQQKIDIPGAIQKKMNFNLKERKDKSIKI